MRLGTQTVTRLGRSGESTADDDFGNPVPGAPGADLVISGCSVQPGNGSELVDNRDAVTTLFTVWAPPSDVLETDAIRYDGTVYAVDGQIERWRVGRMAHDVIRLKAVAG